MPDEDYGCDVCHDAGFIRRQRELDDPEFGKSDPCPKCRPQAAPRLPEGLQNCTFGSFDVSLNPKMRLAFNQVQRVAEPEDTAAWCAVLVGDPGLGKSHLAAAALNREGAGVFWETGALLLNIRHLCFSESGPHLPEDTVLETWQRYAGILVLDDLGAEKLTEWAQQTLYGILNARYQAKLRTIITTNRPEAIDDRILSRYAEGIVSCEGRDVRRMAR